MSPVWSPVKEAAGKETKTQQETLMVEGDPRRKLPWVDADGELGLG